MAPTVGVLALQGAFRAHLDILDSLGARPLAIRRPQQLAVLDALIIPGGESTTMSKLAVSAGLVEPLVERMAAGLPTLGTCAGAILLATDVLDGRVDQVCLGALDLCIRRNGYGTQLDSFEVDLEIEGIGSDPFHAVFIRAPVIESVGPSVRILARHRGSPAVVESGSVTATTFHPELTGDVRLHRRLLDAVGSARTPG